LTWGAKSDIPPVKTGVGFAGCCQEDNDETGRNTEQVTIHDSSNPDNYIVVNRATQLQWDKSTKDNCAGNWDQFSGVGLEITSALDEFAGEINSGTAAGDNNPNTCKETLHLSANTVAS
jgi:hypothetical protein